MKTIITTVKKPASGSLLVFFFGLLLLVGACSSTGDGEKPDSRSRSSAAETTGVEEGTLSSPATGSEAPTRREGTLGTSAGVPDLVLRLEGDPKTRFSGICDDGSEETVIEGRVPKRFGYDLSGEGLSCRIEKQDANGGILKVILTAGETTRSVQQTNVRGGVVEISYKNTG